MNKVSLDGLGEVLNIEGETNSGEIGDLAHGTLKGLLGRQAETAPRSLDI